MHDWMVESRSSNLLLANYFGFEKIIWLNTCASSCQSKKQKQLIFNCSQRKDGGHFKRESENVLKAFVILFEYRRVSGESTLEDADADADADDRRSDATRNSINGTDPVLKLWKSPRIRTFARWIFDNNWIG